MPKDAVDLAVGQQADLFRRRHARQAGHGHDFAGHGDDEAGTGGQTQFTPNRLYIQPGSMLKFNKGAALDVLDPGASLNVGSRSYINGFDANPGYNPSSPGFVDESATDPAVRFTSIYDDTATTPFVPASWRR